MEEINEYRIKELEQLIKEDRHNFQDNVNKYICTLDDMDGIMVEQYLKRLRNHIQELKIWKGEL